MQIFPIHNVKSTPQTAEFEPAVYNPACFPTVKATKPLNKDTVEIKHSESKGNNSPKYTQQNINAMSSKAFKAYAKSIRKKYFEILPAADYVYIERNNALLLDKIAQDKRLYNNSSIRDLLVEISMEEGSADSRIQLIDKYLSNERLYNNHSLQQEIGELLFYCFPERAAAQIKIMDKFITDTRMHNNSAMVKNLGEIIQSTANSEEAKAKIKVINGFLSDKKISENQRLSEIIGDIIISISGPNEAQYKLKTMKKFVSDKNIYLDPMLNDRIFNIINSVSTEEGFMAAEKFLSNPDLYNNEHLLRTMSLILASLQSSNDSGVNRTELIDKFLSDEKLYNNYNFISHFPGLLMSIKNPLQYSIAKRLMSDEKLYNNENLISDLGGEWGTLSKIQSEGTYKLINKILDAPELFVRQGYTLRNLVRSSDEEDIKLKSALIDRIISNPEKFKSYGAFLSICDVLYYTKNPSYYLHLSDDNNSELSTMPFKFKIKAAETLSKFVSSNLFTEEEKEIIEGIKRKVTESFNQTIPTYEITNAQRKTMFQGFFSNKDIELEELIKTADFEKYAKDGLPLKYSRKEFLRDLNETLNNVSAREKREIFNKLKINAILNSEGQITGYDGIIDLKGLSNDGIEGKVSELSNKFIFENEVRTGDEKLNKALNSLFQGMSEFINIIGKQQHETQEYSLDIHILKVLQEAMKLQTSKEHPEFNQLSNLDKTCLKFAIILHDIAKSEGVIDKNHPHISALYARNIMEKYNFPAFINDRIFELIKNHHWLAEYDKEGNYQKMSALFRHKDDYTIARIMAEADLKGVSNSFYNIHKDALTPSRLRDIENSLTDINSKGQLVFTTKIIQKEKIPTVNYKGRDYQLIDFTNIPDDKDLSEYGFIKGTKKDDVRLFVHMAEKAENLDTVNALSDIANSGFLCASYVSLKNCRTYYNLRYGVSLECENVNIANASNSNQSSGGKKEFNDFVECITEQDRDLSQYRSFIPRTIMSNLNLRRNEYSKLYENLAQKQYLTQIRQDDKYKTGEKVLEGRDVLNAVITAQEGLLSHSQNESNLYNPKINAFVAKVNNIEDIPDNMLDFAYRNGLPIYLLGEKK